MHLVGKIKAEPGTIKASTIIIITIRSYLWLNPHISPARIQKEFRAAAKEKSIVKCLLLSSKCLSNVTLAPMKIFPSSSSAHTLVGSKRRNEMNDKSGGGGRRNENK